MQTTRTTQAAKKWWRTIGLGLAPFMILSGCQSDAGTGALVGGGAGAVLGNVIAKATGGSRTAGTILGGGLGAVAGTAVGSASDAKKDQARVQAALAPTAGAPTVSDIVSLTQSGVDPNVIISQIQTTRARYDLRSEDIQYLTQSRVHPAVIRVMQDTAAPRVIYTQPSAVYVAEPPPPVGVGVGVSVGGRFR